MRQRQYAWLPTTTHLRVQCTERTKEVDETNADDEQKGAHRIQGHMRGRRDPTVEPENEEQAATPGDRGPVRKETAPFGASVYGGREAKGIDGETVLDTRRQC